MTETWSWIDVTGVAWPMNNFTAGLEVLQGVQGRGIPPIRRTRDVIAGQAGTRLRDVKHDMRTLQVPLLLSGATESERAALLDSWTHNVDPARGSGTIELTNATGVPRRLTARYAQGLELVEDASSRWPGKQLAVVVFEADDPYWYDVGETSIRFSATTTAPVWFPGGVMLPIVLGSSAVLGGSTIIVDSDVDVWPRWTITGPGVNIVIRNDTTGREFIWNATLTGGQQLLIDARPGVMTVLREDGSNRFASLTAWDLFPLVPGANNINVNMTGTSAASSIVAAWANRRLTQ